MPGPTTADVRAGLGRPLPMHVCLRAGMCAGAWAGPCRRGRVGADGPAAALASNVRPTSGRALDVRRLCLGRRPFPPGCRAHSRGRGRRARPRARTTCAAGRGTWTVRACWVFVVSRKAPSLSCGKRAHARPVGHRAGGSLAVGHGTRTASKATGTDDVRRRPRDVDGRPVPRVGFSLFHARHHLFRADARTRSPLWHIFHPGLGHFDPGLGHFFGTRAKQGTRAGGSPRAVPGEKNGDWRGRGGRDESKRQRAESQRIVAARPLCRLQYPVAYLSRLQRILPAARWELYFKAASAARPPRWLGQRHVPLGALGPLLRVGKRTAGVRVASSPDSDLEAFSHNPAHGSFAPLAFQPSAMTNCANQRFLSY
ncbi:UNVERIFIED_CONTAM: hypothetical protein Sindi_3113400 [Sesamum indicum]